MEKQKAGINNPFITTADIEKINLMYTTKVLSMFYQTPRKSLKSCWFNLLPNGKYWKCKKGQIKKNIYTILQPASQK